jgi:IS4 transposase
MGIRDSLIGIRQRYRKRFGIESGYRQLEQLRIRTTSPNPALRLMIVGIALVLLNVWVWAQWRYLRKPGRGPRRIDHVIFQLRRFQTFILAAVTAIYGQIMRIDLTPYRPAPLAPAKW